MVIIEKPTHPKPKLYAGGVTRIRLETLRILSQHLPPPIPGVEIGESRLFYMDSTIKLRGQPILLSITV